MGLQEWIDDANASCARGKALLGFGSDVWTREVSNEESDILHAAAEAREIRLRADAGSLYPALLSEGKPIFARESDFDRHLQWDAFTSLCLRGLLDPGPGGSYRMSEAGWNRGRQIRARRMSGLA